MDFGEEYGPLPLGAWVAVIGGAFGIALYSRYRNGSAGGTTVVEDGRAQVGVGEGFDAYIPAVNASPTGPTVAPITTNDEWAKAAINWLIAEGYDAAVADAAIRKYLAVERLTPQEYALVRLALVHLGSPPIPLPPPPEAPTIVTTPVVVTTPQPTPKPVPSPRQIRIIIVEPWRATRSTLFGMAKEFYGNGNRWPEIYAANKKGITRPDGSPGFISNPNYLRPGDRVYVP